MRDEDVPATRGWKAPLTGSLERLPYNREASFEDLGERE
jgi:hypothetical protein